MQHRLLLIGAIALAACHSSNPAMTPLVSGGFTNSTASPHHGSITPSVGPLPVEQLARVRSATARYQDVQTALKDGYVDIDVVLPNMGRHFMKESLVDATFEVDRPELLVYTQEPQGRLALVAVEYAVPLSLTATAPDGFKGLADQWFADQRFKLWTLHAWVWRENPAGVFNPTNSKVP